MSAAPLPRPRRKPRNSNPELIVRKPDAEVWRRALLLADGDPRRLDVLDDGAVMVHNKPVR